MRVLLARHGQTDWNAAGKIQGASDIPLNDTGRGQARALAEKLRAGKYPVKAIYTSPLLRARETAELVGEALGVAVECAPELTELNFGDWEGCSWGEIGERWPEQFAAYSADRRNYAPPGGESYADMLSRARPFLDSLRRKPGGTVLCVCHSAVMRGLLADLQGMSVNESYKRLRLPNGIVVPVESLQIAD